ncbi:transcriptional regulator, LysR family [Polaromonas sp. OV174]|uniref:LysR family transcriptional regulator n=1 Tax=Polaromonas sp. OV174 TaxID=1855300 RepID=UPI0008EB5976|nr:LysR family transcriptional regulator [Polaromonas sp. OV174]SFB89999.1 transcriptional regulator, LysR family [Polaromonas sp. OV174]
MAKASTEFLGSRRSSVSPLADLTTLQIFVQTVDLGSFSEVARRIDVNPAMVSKRIASLERKVGHRLLNRSTRHLVLTEAGQQLYDHCVRALIELDQAAEALASLQDRASGLLRITAPALLGQAMIAPKLPQFLIRNPKLSVDIDFLPEQIDLFKNRVDIAVRITDTLDPGLIAIKLAPYGRAFCAAPEYLRLNGTPTRPEDLIDHNCLVTRGAVQNRLNRRWPVRKDGEISSVPVKGSLTTDSGNAARLACLAGLGVILGPRWLLDEDIRVGRLTEILVDFAPDNRSVYALLLERTNTSAKLHIAIEFLKLCFADIQYPAHRPG